MPTEELMNLMKDMESDRIERKASDGNRDRICEAICAFSNDLPNNKQPGYILIGVKDDGTCANLPITDELLRTLAGLRDRGTILPLPVMSVEQVRDGACTFACIRVEPHPSPPVAFDGRTWIRVGPRRAIATRDEERMLLEKQRSASAAFDSRPFVGASIDDLNIDRFQGEYLPHAVARDVLRENHRLPVEQLMALRLAPAGIPNLASILAFADDPRRLAPAAYIQFVRYDGENVFAPIMDEKEIDGPLGSMLVSLDDLLRVHIRSSVDFTSKTRETESADYPLVALQQIVRNAIMHRNYESSNAPVRLYWFTDRVEIHSPGGLYGSVTPENFGHPGFTDYRNPVVAEVMKVLGFVQRFGVGVATAQHALQANGNPPAVFDFSQSAVLAIVRTR